MWALNEIAWGPLLRWMVAFVSIGMSERWMWEQGGKVWERRQSTGRNSAGIGEWKAQEGPNAERAQNRNRIDSSMQSTITWITAFNWISWEVGVVTHCFDRCYCPHGVSIMGFEKFPPPLVVSRPCFNNNPGLCVLHAQLPARLPFFIAYLLWCVRHEWRARTTEGRSEVL